MLENILGIIFSIPFAFSILRITTPILFALAAAPQSRRWLSRRWPPSWPTARASPTSASRAS